MEILDIVNDKDEVIGQLSYDEAYKTKSTIRLVHIFIFNKKGDLVIQQRGYHKPKNGGTWMTSAGGHVRSGESYEKAAKRELKEELGIEVPLEFKWKEVFSDNGHTKFSAAFYGEYNSEDFVIDPVETLQAKVVSFTQLKEMIQNGHPMHPEFLRQLKERFGF